MHIKRELGLAVGLTEKLSINQVKQAQSNVINTLYLKQH